MSLSFFKPEWVFFTFLFSSPAAGHLTLQDKDILTLNGNSQWEQYKGVKAIMRLAPQALRLGLDRSQRTASHKSIFTRRTWQSFWAGLILRVSVIIFNPSFLFKAHKNQRLGGTRPPQYHIYSNNNVTALSPTAPYHCSYLMIINIQYMTGERAEEKHSLALIGCFSPTSYNNTTG